MNDLVLLESTIQLSNNLVNLLGAKTGDRIVIGYASNDGTLIPAISIGDSGNKLSGKNTIVFIKGKENYINTHEYHVILVLRSIGIHLTYCQAKQFLEEAEDRSIDFGTKHPWMFTDEEIIEEYNRYFK